MKLISLVDKYIGRHNNDWYGKIRIEFDGLHLLLSNTHAFKKDFPNGINGISFNELEKFIPAQQILEQRNDKAPFVYYCWDNPSYKHDSRFQVPLKSSFDLLYEEIKNLYHLPESTVYKKRLSALIDDRIKEVFDNLKVGLKGNKAKDITMLEFFYKRYYRSKISQTIYIDKAKSTPNSNRVSLKRRKVKYDRPQYGPAAISQLFELSDNSGEPILTNSNFAPSFVSEILFDFFNTGSVVSGMTIEFIGNKGALCYLINQLCYHSSVTTKQLSRSRILIINGQVLTDDVLRQRASTFARNQKNSYMVDSIGKYFPL